MFVFGIIIIFLSTFRQDFSINEKSLKVSNNPMIDISWPNFISRSLIISRFPGKSKPQKTDLENLCSSPIPVPISKYGGSLKS